jgi:DNA-binding response OmpR family regulator
MKWLLVADDETTICFALSDFFTLRGFQVDCVQRIEEAFEILKSRTYAAAIIDLRLTGTDNFDGLLLLQRLRDVSPATRCIVLTACEEAGVEAASLKAGADAFLRKPQSLSALAEVVSNLIEKKGGRGLGHDSGAEGGGESGRGTVVAPQ